MARWRSARCGSRWLHPVDVEGGTGNAIVDDGNLTICASEKTSQIQWVAERTNNESVQKFT